MPIVSSCLGGLSGAVAQGMGELTLSWITNDGENQQCTFNISGTTSKTVQSDANGLAVVTLPAGTYNVTVTHTGEYIGDDGKSITLLSRQKATLTWLAGAKQAQVVRIYSPGVLNSSSVSYSIKLSGTVVESGSTTWPTDVSYNLFPGEYVLTISAYGTTINHSFTVPKTSGIEIDLASYFCKITVSSAYNVKNVTLGGYVAGGTGSYASSQTFYALRTTSSKSVGGTVNTPTPPQYGGLSTKYYYDWNVSSANITPSGATASAYLSVSKSINRLTILSSGSLNIPKAGKFLLHVVGAGGHAYGYDRSSYSEETGGCGAHMSINNSIDIPAGTYTVTVGTAANSMNVNSGAGGPSSFGTIASAEGGGTGSGGSGGGGGLTGYAKAGRSGSQFGGGGGAGDNQYNSGAYNRGGSSGSYGGDGGSGGGRISGASGMRNGYPGSAGVDLGNGQSYNGGSGGTSTTGTGSSNSRPIGACGGGGGGGGWGAIGGAGGAGYANKTDGRYHNGGGGGGGGYDGGSGGDGGRAYYYNSSTSKYAYILARSGKGYGAGGAGYLYGGGGGGYGPSQIAPTTGDEPYSGTGTIPYFYGGGKGADGIIVLQWLSD